LVDTDARLSSREEGYDEHNAPMESFFHSLKTERVHHRIYGTRAEARRDLFQYIEGFYNSRRLHSALGYISPAFAERMAA
jgi:transposase InsO family protein